MVGVGIPALVVAVGEDHLRPVAADEANQAAHGIVDRRLPEALRMIVRRIARHTRVSIAEQVDAIEADDLGRSAQLAQADLGQPIDHLGPIHRRVEHLTELAAGAAHQRRTRSLSDEAGDERRPLRRFIVGVRVNAQQAKRRLGVASGRDEF